jgi:hypothetical protein
MNGWRCQKGLSEALLCQLNMPGSHTQHMLTVFPAAEVGQCTRMLCPVPCRVLQQSRHHCQDSLVQDFGDLTPLMCLIEALRPRLQPKKP